MMGATLSRSLSLLAICRPWSLGFPPDLCRNLCRSLRRAGVFRPLVQLALGRSDVLAYEKLHA